MLYYIILHYVILYYVILHYIILHCILYYILLYYIILYFITLYYITLYYYFTLYLLFEAGACHVTWFLKYVVKRKWARGGGLIPDFTLFEKFPVQ